MTKFNELSWQVDEATYRQDPAYSYSIIAKYDREGILGIPTLFDNISTPSLLFGSVVDTLLTDKDNFDKLYVVVDIPNITSSLEPIAKQLVEDFGKTCNSLEDVPEEAIAIIGEAYDYYKGEKYAKTRVKKIKEGCEAYFQACKRVNGKTIISNQLYQDARECVEELKTNPYTKNYFADIPFSDIERFYQLKFKSTFGNIPIRGMLDLVIVDHKNKIIIPVDIKTSYKPEWEFYESYMTWKYYHQSNLYTQLLKDNIKGTEYESYTITPYYFIVISRNTKTPMVWKDDRNNSIVPFEYKNEVYRNWRVVIEELDEVLRKESKYPLWVQSVNNLSEFLR